VISVKDIRPVDASRHRRVPPLTTLHGIVASLRHRPWRTTQESLIASLLRDLDYQYQEQWLLVVDAERLLFDFLVEDRILLECMECTSPQYAQAWGTLRRRLTYLDFKFRLAKTVGTFTTIILTEAPACPRPAFPYPQTLTHLAATDYVVTSLPQLGDLLIHQLATEPVTAQSVSAQEYVDRWLRTEINRPAKKDQNQSRTGKYRCHPSRTR
jgi:hypothetical protein